MTDQPITPPPELVQQWADAIYSQTADDDQRDLYIATRAAQYGADQELQACCEWLSDCGGAGSELRVARRPKPPSLKEQALAALERYEAEEWCEEMTFDSSIIRRALEHSMTDFQGLCAELCGAIASQDSKSLNPVINETYDKAIMALADEKGADASRYLKYIEELSDVLVSCSEMISEWGAYADEYYQKKHCLDADVAYAKSHAARAKRVAEQTDRLGEYDD